MTDRKLASIRKISKLIPILDADAIECAEIDGWSVVVKKGEFQEGDLCVYIEVDSFIPLGNPYFDFLKNSSFKEWNGKQGFRLRIAKLRGCISCGLALPISSLDYYGYLSINTETNSPCLFIE
jgi:RNA ligase (TIGR02306 family)